MIYSFLIVQVFHIYPVYIPYVESVQNMQLQAWPMEERSPDRLHHHPERNRPESCRYISEPLRRWRYTPGIGVQYPLQKRMAQYSRCVWSCCNSRRQCPPQTPQKPRYPEGPGDTGRWADPAEPAVPSLSASPLAFLALGWRSGCPNSPHSPSVYPAA